MPNDDPRQKELVTWFQEQGHGDPQIERILAKVAEYDAQTLHESIFDSIDRGDFSIGALIDEALGEK